MFDFSCRSGVAFYRQLQDLAYKIKAQLLLWDEINAQFEKTSAAIKAQWQSVSDNPRLQGWVESNTEAHLAVLDLLSALKGPIDETSYYSVGKIVDFQLYQALDPMLDQINAQRLVGRQQAEAGAVSLIEFLDQQQHFLVAGSLVVLFGVLLLTYWLRRTVTTRLQLIAERLRSMEVASDLSQPLPISGRDEVTAVALAINGLIEKFKLFLGDAVQASSQHNNRQIYDVVSSMSAITGSASQIQTSAEDSRTQVAGAVKGNDDVHNQLRESEVAAELAVAAINRVSGAIEAVRGSSEKIEQVISVIANIAT
ncbi:MAG TPA: methyl-accepting chemotaxis protein, partial [Marinobacter sp.]|nr:methyl-accepting chemotaxis protein [Marinobacter sp.]